MGGVARGQGELWYAGCQSRVGLPLGPGPPEPNHLHERRIGVLVADVNSSSRPKKTKNIGLAI